MRPGRIQFFLLAFLFLGTEAPLFSASKELPPNVRLRKLSLHLRGLLPSQEEYEALSKTKDHPFFFKERTEAYLKTPQHAGKMVDRLDELFRVRVSNGLPETRLTSNLSPSDIWDFNAPGSETYNAMDLLFERVARENLPWDTLAIGHEYQVVYRPVTGDASIAISDVGFLNAIVPGLPLSTEGVIRLSRKPDIVPRPPVLGKPYSISFDKDDERIGGAVTTARFFNRYHTTNLNRSRSRSAALFRIFLCDDMRAVVETGEDSDRELLENAFPKNASSEKEVFKQVHSSRDSANEARHGTQPFCMSCHYKLDPLGQSFFTHSNAFSPVPAPGALVYRRADGSLVNLPGNGLGTLLKFITQQPEYSHCQVQHFWKWFIHGKNPSLKRLQELVNQFEKSKRLTNDFIAYLVNQPEFYQEEVESNSSTLIEVRPILERCDGCHSGLTEPPPSFARLTEHKEREYWISNIVDRLDLLADGKNRTMPPDISVWQPSSEDLALIKNWIMEGAKDEEGKRSLSEEFVKNLFKEKEKKR